MALHVLLQDPACQPSQLTVRKKMQLRIGAQMFRLSSEGDRVTLTVQVIEQVQDHLGSGSQTENTRSP